MSNTLEIARNALTTALAKSEVKTKFVLILLNEDDQTLQVCGDVDPIEAESVLRDVLISLEGELGLLKVKDKGDE